MKTTLGRRCVRIGSGSLILLCLMGADSISFDKDQPRVHPGGQINAAGGKGSFTLDPANDLDKVVFHARFVTTKQRTEVPAKVEKQNWNATLELVEGEYEVWVELHTLDKQTGVRTTTATKPVTIKVTPPKKA